MRRYHVVCSKCDTEYVLDRGETAVDVALEIRETCDPHIHASELTVEGPRWTGRFG
jgi:hypothetical protein